MALLEASVDGKMSWFEIPTPSPENYSPTYTHLERSYQDSVGYLHRDIVRRNRANYMRLESFKRNRNGFITNTI